MRASLNIMWSTGRSEAALLAEIPVPIDVRPIRGARRLRLRFDEAAGVLKLTCPPRTSRARALAWALDQRDWIDAQLARALPPEPFEHGARIPLEGEETLLVWDEGAPRTPELADGRLRCGGPPEAFGRRIESWLKRRALATLSDDTAHFAALAGVGTRAVAVGDAATRWGSCSSDGRIRFSWRLISPRLMCAATSSRTKSRISSISTTVPSSRRWRRGCPAPAWPRRKPILRRLGPRLRRIGRRR